MLEHADKSNNLNSSILFQAAINTMQSVLTYVCQQ